VQIAEFNVARLAIALDDPSFQRYLEAVGVVQAEADSADGFVWRDQYLATFDDPNPFGPDVLATISVWRSIETLRAFTYSGRHRESFTSRHEWFEMHEAPRVVLWWVSDGHRPNTEESKTRLAHLVEHGPTAYAFTFARSFPAPEDPISSARRW
jgi:hypothetical protein